MSFPIILRPDNKAFFTQIGFVLFLIISQLGFYFTSPSDFVAHVNLFDKCVNGSNNFPGNPAYYTLLYLGQFISSSKKHLVILSLVLCSIAKIATYILTIRILQKQTKSELYTASWLAGLVCISFSIYEPIKASQFGFFYLGSIPPNVYHNPTTILCMPFVLLCYKSIIDGKNNLTTTTWAVLCAFTKPSFLLSLAPALGALWVLNRKKNHFIQAIIISIIIFIQFFLIFILGIGTPEEHKSFITFLTPFKFLTTFTNGWLLPITMLASFALPLWYITHAKAGLNLAFLNFLFAGAIAILVHEAGPREDHGNFIWQWVIASFIIFIEAIAWVYKTKNKFGIALMALHALSGIAYPIHSILNNTYK